MSAYRSSFVNRAYLGVLLCALLLVGSLFAACGAKTQGESVKTTRGDATATFAVAMTQIADAKNFVATSTAEARSSLPAATAATTVSEAQPTPTVNPFANATPSANYDGDLLASLPALEQLPQGYEVGAEGPLTAEDVASSYLDEVGYMRKLEAWGFRQAAARVFVNGTLMPNDKDLTMNLVNTAVIEFNSPEQSLASMEDNREYIRKGMIGDPPKVTLEGLGDYAIALQGGVFNESGKIEQWAFVWVQKDNLVYYVRTMAPGYAPMDEAIQIATATLTKEQPAS